MFHVKQFILLFILFPFISFSQHFGSTVLPVKPLPVLPAKDALILDLLQSAPEYNSLNPYQKEWFYWTNYSRRNPKVFWDSVVVPILENYPTLNNSNTVSLKSDLYNSTPLPPTKPSLKLLETSQRLASELSSKTASPSHTSPSGATFSDRMKASGITKCAGENISFGPLNPVLMLVLLYLDEGVQGVGHRRALLNPSFVEMGIGIADYPDNKAIVVQDFACEQK
ncbi:CAP domain-containing protein [Segetibacter koreensis]|uniref:CAP domain-containing protein n=1 Tax=Segetibacter koreensis TaxID=398037 RepID=UPI0003747168|nr:CAP domain-containing protein [Segetibacter koreensis]